MAGVIKNVSDALHIGGDKSGEHKECEQHKTGEQHKIGEQHKTGEHKEGFVEKVKDKVLGDGGVVKDKENK